jgi:hypothetical protein
VAGGERLDLRSAHVSRDHEQRVARREVLPVEGDQVLAIEPLDGRRHGGDAVGMLAVDLREEPPLRDRAGLPHLCLERGEGPPADRVELPLREGRAQRNVAHQVEGKRQVLTEHRRAHREPVATRGGGEAAAHPFDGLRDLLRGTALRALREQVADHPGAAGMRGRVRCAAGADIEVDVHDRLPALLHDDHGQTVRQACLPELRELKRPLREGSGRRLRTGRRG